MIILDIVDLEEFQFELSQKKAASGEKVGAKQEEEEAPKQMPLPDMKWRNCKITNVLGNFLFCLIST